jgi:hypothetical protein
LIQRVTKLYYRRVLKRINYAPQVGVYQAIIGK